MTKSVYIPAPCGAYDIEVTQLWLEEMAGRGLMLTHDGFFAGIGIFSKGKSTHVLFYQTSSDYSMPLDEFIKLEAECIG